MLETLLEMDRKGIIAKGFWSEERYIAEGSAMQEAAASIEVDEAYRLAFLKKHRALVYCRRNVPQRIAEQVSMEFKTDVSWVPLLYSDSRLGDSGWAVNTGDINSKGNAPAIVIFDGGDSTLFHECIHTIRNFVNYGAYAEFEEAIACYKKIRFSFLESEKKALEKEIHYARKKLDDAVGIWAGYVLMRLTPGEIGRISRAKNPFMHLKSLDSLRHRIVKERIGI